MNARTVLVCLICGLCLFIPSIVVLFLVPGSPSQDHVQVGAFRCDAQSTDYGEVRIGQPVQHTFKLSNTSNAPRRILKVTPGCSCTTVDHFSKEVPANAVGEVTVVIDTTGDPGIRQSSVLIETDDPQVPRLNPLVSCRVLAAVSANPDQLRFVADGSTGTFNTQTVEVVGLYGNETIGLGQVQASDPLMVIDKESTQGELPLRFKVAINEKLPAGLTLCHLVVGIEGSAQKNVRLPVKITNETKLKSSPPLLELALVKDEVRNVEFTVECVDHSPLQVTKVEVADKPLQVFLRQVASDAVTVGLEGMKVTRELDHKYVRVITNQGDLRVPITVHQARKTLPSREDAAQPELSLSRPTVTLGSGS